MSKDDLSHFLIYSALGVSIQEGKNIDLYQNKGRFLYRHAGSFLEKAVKLCFTKKNPSAKSVKIKNSIGLRPKTFEIDCLDGENAYEIKWRDATTDGDHITKEHTRIKTIANSGLIPIRLMFFKPNRGQAIKIQDTLKALYEGVNGRYYAGEDAWSYIRNETKIDLKKIIKAIASEN
tara:strand:+ start:1435 stop:1965 length:531 start_codon:yes stop_codon:yes gene_type:complete